MTAPVRHRIDDSDRDEIVRAHAACPPPADDQAFARDAYSFGCRHLPKEVIDLLHSFSDDIHGSGLAVIENLPVGELGDTPGSDQEYFARADRDRLSERVLMAVGEQLGSVYAYANERQGFLINNIVPTEGDREVQSSNGSSRLLPLHTEDIHQYPYTPDCVVLFCLREEPDQEAYTQVLDTRAVVEELPDSMRSILQQPLFLTEPPPVYGGAKNRDPQPTPVIQGGAPSYKVQVEFNDTRATTAEAERALEELKTRCSTTSTLLQLKLKAGDLAILDNNKVLHGRGPFASSFGPERRWLQRVKVKTGNLFPWRELVDHHRVIAL
jgi:L-asparagine oxygenase